MMNCDWQHMLEDGGVGAIVMAIIWGLWNWWRSREDKAVIKKSQYEK